MWFGGMTRTVFREVYLVFGNSTALIATCVAEESYTRTVIWFFPALEAARNSACTFHDETAVRLEVPTS